MFFFFSFDVMINFNTAYYFKGILIKNKKKIVINYLKTNFILDTITIIPMFLLYFYDLRQIQLIFLLRFININKLFKELDEYLQLSHSAQAAFELIKLSIFILYLAHLFCCAFHYIAILEIEYKISDNTWLHLKNLIDKSWIDKYINSLYFTVVTMITVGYGDISPENNIEKVFCTVFMLISCISYGYIINRIGQIIVDLSKNEVAIK